MINSIEEFSKKFNNSVIVNYDIADVFDYGLAYRMKTKRLERFRKDKGKYIVYPYIQPYLYLNDDNYSLFIILNNKMFKLKKGSREKTYNIENEVPVNLNIFNDIFYNKSKIKDPANRNDEPIYMIEE